MAGVRQRHLLDAAAELLDPLQRPLEDLEHAGLEALAGGQLRRHAEAQPLERLGGSGSAISSGWPSEVESHGSRPTMWRRSSAASVTSRVSGPAWSSEEAKAIIP